MMSVNGIFVTVCVILMMVWCDGPQPTMAQVYASYSTLPSISPKRSYLKHANSVRARFPTFVRADIVFRGTNDVDAILHNSIGLTGGEIITTRTRPSRVGNCRTPESQQGQCLLVSQCPVYMPLIKNIRDSQVSDFLRNRICRLEVNNVRICCPNDPQNAVLPTSSSSSQSQTSRPSSEGFDRPQLHPPQSTEPVRISFGGSSNNNKPNLPIAPAQNRPSTSLPVAPAQNRPSISLPVAPTQRPPSTSLAPQNRPFVTTSTVPRTSSQSAGGSFFPNTQNGVNPTQNPIFHGQFPTSLPVRPPQTLPPQPILHPTQQPSQVVVPSQGPQIGVSFAPSNLQPDRMNFVQSQETTPTSSPIQQVPVNLIPSESECGSSSVISNLRSNALSNWPWLAAIGYLQEGGKFEVMCGGAIITRRHVITAAHCLSLNRVANRIPTHIRLGDYDRSRSSELASPLDILIESHQTPGYEAHTFVKDVAIITLSQDIAFNGFIQPICLPFRFLYDGFRYQSLNVVGWRDTLLIKDPRELPQTSVVFKSPVSGLSECRSKYQRSAKSVAIDRNNLCAASSSGETCLRDSGALALYLDEDTTNRYFLVGLGSFGFGCDRPDEPYVYTRVGAFLKWIVEVISNGSSTSSSTS